MILLVLQLDYSLENFCLQYCALDIDIIRGH